MNNSILRFFLIGALSLFSSVSFCQNEKRADSLILVFESRSDDSNALHLLREIIEEVPNPETQLAYAELLVSYAKQDKRSDLLCDAYNAKGNALKSLGDYTKALDAYFLAFKLASALKDAERKGSTSIAIATAYSDIGDQDNSHKYFNSGIQSLRLVNDSVKLGTALLNAGDEYFLNNKLDSAKILTQEAGLIFKLKNYQIGTAYYLGNMGLIYASQKKDSMALLNINKAIDILEELGDYYPISVYLTYISDIYKKNRAWEQAFSYTRRSLDLALQYSLKPQISEAYLQLSELYELLGRVEESFKNYKQHIIYRDSVTNIESVREMANLQTKYEVSQKQIEVDLLHQKQRNQRITVIATIIALVLIAILAMGLFRRNRFIQKTSNIIQEERDRSDNLLRNILPQDTAQELKEKGKVEAKRFESVSVMFTDFKGFTAYSANLSPEELVESVNYYYSKFDEIMEKYSLEKIKTVGDAYMAAGGLPFPTPDHALKMVEAAIEIADFVRESKKFDPDDMTRFDIRIGINTGPVVAGVVGTKKFAYDIWGDTVNIASRMESNSEPGKINVSENTYQLIKDQYNCAYRGEIEAKNKGKLNMYFVEKKIL